MAHVPAISVLIPSYNHGAYIEQTIRSVLNQTERDFELLILDDGSTDDSPARIERLAQSDGRIRYWRQANAGLIATLNTLADQARGTYVAQIDSDDMWTPERLAWGLADMAADPKLAVSFTGFLRIQNDNSPAARADQLELGAIPHEPLVDRMVIKNTVCACTAFMRRSALTQIGPFARNFSLSHDWDRWLRLSMVGRMSLSEQIGALYREHGSNQSLDERTTRGQELQILGDLAETLIDHHALPQQIQAQIYARGAALAFATDQRDAMVAHLLKRSQLTSLSEHEQMWLLHAVLKQKMALEPVRPWQELAAHPKLYSTENKQRLAAIISYAP